MADILNELLNAFRTAGYRPGKTTDNKDIVIRCPYCGHTSSAGKKHMYISVEPPFEFHCFKCDASGVLNSNTIKDFNIFDNDLSLKILEENKNIPKNKQYKKKIKAKELNYGIKNKNIFIQNLNYFNSRYDFNYSVKDIRYLISKYKIIFDPVTFFEKNNIPMPNGFQYWNSIGFVSNDNKFAVFRDTSRQQKMRYSNVKLNQDDEEASKVYTCETSLDVLADSIDIVITEGIFDIIGVKEHFYKDMNENIAFIAGCGKSFELAVNKMIRIGFLEFNLYIYSDADVDVNVYRRIKANSKYLKNKRITIFYNELSKDFGVPKNEIKLRKVVI